MLLLVGILGITERTLRPPASEPPPPAPELPPISAEGLEASAPRSHPDVVVILIDTLRIDHLDLMGFSQPTAPFLAALAADSVVFERGFSTSGWTAPSTASVFTGMYAHNHGIIEGLYWHNHHMEELAAQGETTYAVNRIHPELTTLPEAFAERGYATVGLTTNMNISEPLGFSEGFDRFWHLNAYPAESLRTAVEQIAPELEAAGPSLLYLHLNDAHNPYHRHEAHHRSTGWRSLGAGTLNPFVARWTEALRADYLSEVGYLDAQIQAMVELLGLQDDILVVLSDHGEAFLEHGQMGHQELHHEVNRALVMIHAPGRAQPRRIHHNVSLIDVLPTLLQLAGLPPVEGLDGISLAPLVQGGAAPSALDERTLYAHMKFHGSHWAAIQGDLKAMELPDGSVSLYDLAQDPAEQHDLAASRPEAVAALLQQLPTLKEQLADAQQREDLSQIPITDELHQQLEQLGYISD